MTWELFIKITRDMVRNDLALSKKLNLDLIEELKDREAEYKTKLQFNNNLKQKRKHFNAVHSAYKGY